MFLMFKPSGFKKEIIKVKVNDVATYTTVSFCDLLFLYHWSSQYFAITKRLQRLLKPVKTKQQMDDTAVIVAATSIVECTMLCVRSDKTALFDEVEKICRCLERSDPSDRRSPACTISVSEESSIMEFKVK